MKLRNDLRKKMGKKKSTHLNLFLQIVNILLTCLLPLIVKIKLSLLKFFLVLKVTQAVRDLTVLVTLKEVETEEQR